MNQDMNPSENPSQVQPSPPLLGRDLESYSVNGYHRRQKGFSLIELMIVVAIVGILGAIAYPSYIQYVQRSHRADAKTALLNDAQFMERNFTESSAYDQDKAGNNITSASLPYQQSPSTGGGAVYNITLANLTATTYTLTATPAAGGLMASDTVCGTLTLDQIGVKGIGGTGNVQECWGR